MDGDTTKRRLVMQQNGGDQRHPIAWSGLAENVRIVIVKLYFSAICSKIIMQEQINNILSSKILKQNF